MSNLELGQFKNPEKAYSAPNRQEIIDTVNQSYENKQSLEQDELDEFISEIHTLPEYQVYQKQPIKYQTFNEIVELTNQLANRVKDNTERLHMGINYQTPLEVLRSY